MNINRSVSNYNIDQLLNEIEVGLNLKLVSKTPGELVDGSVDIIGNDFIFKFNDNLDQTQLDNLDQIISEHTPIENWLDLKKFKLNDSFDDPSNLDYDIMGFHKKRTILFGELRKVEYYLEYNGVTYSNLVVEETRDYTRDVNGLCQTRLQTSKWYLNDGSVGLTKTTTKYYSLTESIQEGIDRRTNAISQTKAHVLVNIGQLYSFDLLTSVKNEIQLYIDGYTDPLRASIQASTKPYLTQGLKDSIVENLRLV